MSLYQLHRCVYDHVRGAGVRSDQGAQVDAARYDLTDEESRAFATRDVAALYQLGLHPVLLNAFCRAVGFARDDYRRMLEPLAVPAGPTPRWRR